MRVERTWGRRRWRFVALVAAIPVLILAGFGVYLASIAGALPWQVDPTPIVVTPFADLANAGAAPISSPTAAVSALSLADNPTDLKDATPGTATAASPIAASPIANASIGTTYAIVGNQSEAIYRVQETVGRLASPAVAVGTTEAIRGQLVLDDDGRPLAGSAVEVDLRTLKSGEPRRDNFVQTITLKDAPLAELEITGVRDWTGPLAATSDQSFQLVGEMTINGVTREMVFDATATRDDTMVTGTASSSFTWKEFNLRAPNVAASMISVEDTVELDLTLTATR